ncbi:hypothetical protein HZS_2152 [Henneguya salminicola]|nr:hypothetical protein HZS_2152 [Henneguya salminicola]
MDKLVMKNKDSTLLPFTSSDITPNMPTSQFPINQPLMLNNNFTKEIDFIGQMSTEEDSISDTHAPATDSTQPPHSVNLCMGDSNALYCSDGTNGNLTDLTNPGEESVLRYDHWCTVFYHEFELAVGEAFKVLNSTPSFSIDGYFDLTNPSGSRMSLGQYTNIHRSDASERTRMYVGKGIELKLINENEIYLFCHSDCSVFLESYYLDEMVQKPHGTVVHKIYPRAYLKFFDFNYCYRSMSSFLQSIPTPISGVIPTFKEDPLKINRALLNTLMKYCGVRYRSWGPDYPRKFIYNTPCWIDVAFTKAVLMMDELLESYKANRQKPLNSPQKMYS